MSVFDYVCLAVIAFSTIICAYKGLRKIIFKICATVFAVLISRYWGNILLNELNISLSPAVGGVVVFLFFFVVFKLVFKIIEGKLTDGVRSIVIDRLLGALVGLFVGTTVVFVFTEIIFIIEKVTILFDIAPEISEMIDNTIIFRFMRNLN